MADERYLIEVRITHDQPLEADAQTIADLAAHGITTALSGDPTLLATAVGQRGTLEPVWVEGYGDGFMDGKLTALKVIEGTLPPVMRLHTQIDRALTRDRVKGQGKVLAYYTTREAVRR